MLKKSGLISNIICADFRIFILSLWTVPLISVSQLETYLQSKYQLTNFALSF